MAVAAKIAKALPVGGFPFDELAVLVIYPKSTGKRAFTTFLQ